MAPQNTFALGLAKPSVASVNLPIMVFVTFEYLFYWYILSEINEK